MEYIRPEIDLFMFDEYISADGSNASDLQAKTNPDILLEKMKKNINVEKTIDILDFSL